MELFNPKIGRMTKNCKPLELNTLTLTLVHYDLGSYEPTYIADHYFLADLIGLNARAQFYPSRVPDIFTD